MLANRAAILAERPSARQKQSYLFRLPNALLLEVIESIPEDYHEHRRYYPAITGVC